MDQQDRPGGPLLNFLGDAAQQRRLGRVMRADVVGHPGGERKTVPREEQIPIITVRVLRQRGPSVSLLENPAGLIRFGHKGHAGVAFERTRQLLEGDIGIDKQID
jgi:hypothetical protein